MFSYITSFFGSDAPKTYSSIIKVKETYLEYINTAKKVVTDIEATLSALDLRDTVISYAEYALDFTVEKIFGNTIGKIISPKIKEAIKSIPEYVEAYVQDTSQGIEIFKDYQNNAQGIDLNLSTEEQNSIVIIGDVVSLQG